MALVKVCKLRSRLPELPVEIIQDILGHVPLQDRLGDCGLVSQAWAGAANRATVQVKHEVSTDKKISLQAWLKKQGQHLEFLDITQHEVPEDAPTGFPLQLPCAKLTQLTSLQLVRVAELQLTAPSTQGAACTISSAPDPADDNHASTAIVAASGCTPILPQLQELQLVRCTMHDPEDLDGFVLPPDLQVLNFCDLQFLSLGEPRKLWRDEANSAAGRDRITAAVSKVLQQLPNLQHLWLENMPLGLDAVEHITAMENLQDFALTTGFQDLPGSGPSTLPTGLTRLEVAASGDETPAGMCPRFLTAIPQLTGLVNLTLETCVLQPQDLTHLTQLTCLSLRTCGFLPADPPDAYNGWHDVEGTTALLGALAKLTRLEELQLRSDRLDTGGLLRSPQEFSTLTASSALTCLVVGDSRQGPLIMALPRGAVQHMFPTGKKLTALQTQHIGPVKPTMEQLNPPELAWCLDAKDLLQIADGCPALTDLGLVGCVVPVVWPTQLPVFISLKLPHLKSLTWGGHAFGDPYAPYIAQLTQLTSLQWMCSPTSHQGLTDVGLKLLTRLQGLDVLHLAHCEALSKEVCPTDKLMLRSEESKGQVWEQLRVLCKDTPSLTDAVIKIPAFGTFDLASPDPPPAEMIVLS